MQKGIYCLESMWNPSVKSKLTVRPILELLEKKNIPTIIFSSTLESKLLWEYSNIIDYVIKDSNGFKYIYKIIQR